MPSPEPPMLRQPRFDPISEEEARDMRGGKVKAGLCVLVGYACMEKGGFTVGLCVLVGVAA